MRERASLEPRWGSRSLPSVDPGGSSACDGLDATQLQEAFNLFNRDPTLAARELNVGDVALPNPSTDGRRVDPDPPGELPLSKRCRFHKNHPNLADHGCYDYLWVRSLGEIHLSTAESTGNSYPLIEGLAGTSVKSKKNYVNEDVGGSWYRFDEYVAENGYIRPAPGAKLERFDPWREFRLAEQREGLPAPYAQLIEISEAAELNRARFPALQTIDAETAERLTSWCRQHGLLGLGLHQVLEVTMPPQFEPRLDPDPDHPSSAEWPVNRRYVRESSGWTEHTEQYFGGQFIDEGDVRVPVARTDLPQGWEPRALYRPLSGWTTSAEWEPLGRHWVDYFPDVPEPERGAFAYPRPQSIQFWEMYAEPFNEIIDAANILRQVLVVAQTATQTETGRPSEVTVARALLWFNRQLALISDALRLDPVTGAPVTHWAAPSLYALLVKMSYLDLIDGVLHRCPACSTLFVSGTATRRYCSTRCKERLKQRRRRGGKETRA